MPHRSNAGDQILPRGVWRAPYLTEQGHPFLVAVDRRGRYVGRAVLFGDEDERVIGRMLWHLLDREDPDCGQTAA